MRTEIRNLYIDGYTAKEIAEILCRSECSVKKFISRNLKDFKKVHEKQKLLKKGLKKLDELEYIKQRYIEGYSSSEIAILLNKSYGYIRNYICENLTSYRREHRKSRSLNKEIKKVVASMANSYISDSAMLKQNRQSYNYDKNNNLEFDETTRSARPSGLPKKIYRRNFILENR